MNEYQKLYRDFLQYGIEAIKKFASDKSTPELKVFCKQNNITYSSKKQFVTTTKQWFQERKLIEEPLQIEKEA